MHAYREHFPFDRIRPEQCDAIEFALDAFLNQGKRFVVLEMGTGCGKSATGVTVARYLQSLYESGDQRVKLGGAYVLTTQKVLQEQYMRDFGDNKGKLKLIKSARNYTCQFYDDRPEKISCAEIRRLLKSRASCSVVYKMCDQSCKFQEAREIFNESPEGTTNYAYFLTAATYTKEVQRRGLLILDEGHNIESALSGFVRIAFSNFFYKHVLGVKTPTASASQHAVYTWLTKTCYPKLQAVIKERRNKVVNTLDSIEAISSARDLEDLERNCKRIETFMSIYDPNKWVLDVSKLDKRGERLYEFKPVDVTEYAQTLLFAYSDRVLVLSATILDRDVFCESIGIDKNNVSFMRIPSPFSPENRPIHFLPVGSMSKAAIEKTLPVMAETVKMLLDQHPNDKGIIHCVNYRVAKYIVDNVKSSRLLTHESNDRDATIERHCQSPDPTVLVSPSMMEGVDLADDMSRFQILCKVPFPYLGDASVKKRMEQNEKWYPYQTVKSIVQAFGRSIRNETDHAVSYILDSDWERFYRLNTQMFPEEFSSALM